MKTFRTLALDVGHDGVAVVTIDVPDRPMNVFTPELEIELKEVVELIATQGEIKGAILTSGKANGFIAGADLKHIVNAYGKDSPVEAYERSQRMSRLFRRIETCGKPFAAAINGVALGGGLELTLACHHRVLSDSPKAMVGLPEVKLGLLPGAGGTQRLPRLIGIAKALPLLLGGASVSPARALELGIVHTVMPPDRLIASAREWLLASPRAQAPWDVKSFTVPGGVGCVAPHANESFMAGTSRLSRSTQRNYPAGPAIMSCVFEGTQVPIDAGLRIESRYFAKLLTDPVARNLVRTMFINRGLADKLVRRPAGVAKTQVRKLGVLGAGMMGAGIAHASAVAGIEVILLDTTQAQADKGRAHAAELLHKEVEGKRLTEAAADAILSRITPTTVYEQLAGSDLVIEAVFEHRGVKTEVISKAERFIGEQTIVASNTSTLPITSLASISGRADRFIGLHFFSPVERMPLVEVILGGKTSDETLARALDFVGILRKTPVVVHDGPGFFTSRIFMSYIDEGMALLAEGVAPALIENAGRMIGMPLGPLAVTDEVTIELQSKVLKQAEADGLPRHFRRQHAKAVIERMMELGRGGRRFGAGFYDYPKEGRKQLWPGLAGSFPASAQQPDVDVVKKRLLYAQALESTRCVEDGVVTHPADADLGSVLGIGFPAWTGGTLSLVDTIGLPTFAAECQRLARKHGSRFRPSNWLLNRLKSGTEFHP